MKSLPHVGQNAICQFHLSVDVHVANGRHAKAPDRPDRQMDAKEKVGGTMPFCTEGTYLSIVVTLLPVRHLPHLEQMVIRNTTPVFIRYVKCVHGDVGNRRHLKISTTE